MEIYENHRFVATVLATAILYVLSLGVRRLFFHRLSSIPGPFICKVTGLWRTYRYFIMSWHDDVVKLHQVYGPVVRVAPDEVSVVDAGAVRKLYSHGSKAKKTTWHDTWAQGTDAPILFSEIDPKIHAALRRRVSAAYAMSNIPKAEGYLQDCFNFCFQRLRKHADAGHIVKMSEWTHMLAFDIVGELTFGQKLGQMETESDIDDIRKINTYDIYWTGNFGHFWLQSRWLHNSFRKISHIARDEFSCDKIPSLDI
ncbi:cytochrome P450 [Thozetella sp. PMI_491]|nr:cytochrome P450 [Thozetella sp. PMI_491]